MTDAAHRMTLEDAPPQIRRNAVPKYTDDAFSLSSLDRWVRRGLVRASKPSGGAVFIDRDSLRAFLEGAAA